VRVVKHREEAGFAALFVTPLTFAVLLVHGYHPYAEDGGVYLPEIQRLVDPALYPRGAEFVVGHLRYSYFAPLVAGLVRISRLRLDTVLFAIHLASLWIMLFAAWLLAVRCFRTRAARCGAVGLLAAWITLPIAGTTLMLMDPYVTARSISSPCMLLALVGALDFLLPQDKEEENDSRRARGFALCCGALAAAIAMHPLMGAYALAAVLLLVAASRRTLWARLWSTAGMAFTALMMAAALTLTAPYESSSYRQVVLTHDYWFLSHWRWYEWIGLIAPLLIVSAVGLWKRDNGDPARIILARMAIAAGCTAVPIAWFFARPAMETHLVARLQPLRIFQIVYIVMILLLGALLAEHILRRSVWRWVAAFSLIATIMTYAERRTFPESDHIELPILHSGFNDSANPWERAFVWIRRNTPNDAMFALDARYITHPGEDAQSFRALAERSALPDFAKDGGIVTNKPELAVLWQRGQQVQKRLSTETDAERLTALRPLGVTWIVLEQGAVTAFSCEYANTAVKVCRLP
jgi:hypothetical protein